MRKSSSPRISDGLVLLDELTGADSRLRKAIAEARLLLEIAQAAHAARARSGMSAEELSLYVGLRPDTVERLERAAAGPQGLVKLRRIAEALELDLRIVLVPRPPRRPGRPVADIARLR
jgi:ribosome-binding protein aMBF1 (putative translation factor)